MSKILVIEDAWSLRMLYTQELQRDGHTVLTVGSAAEGLVLLGTEPVDLVVLETRLPGIDGIEPLQLIREKHAGLPVILNSGYTRPLRGLIPDACIVKSSDTEELRATIIELLSGRRCNRPNQ